MFTNLTPFNLPALELEVLDRWDQQHTFERSLDTNRPEFRLAEGPPTMNGRPGVHHVSARAVKDLVGRYKTMRGYLVRRRAGWDCHGLPVELAVAKRHGLEGRAAVAEFGARQFADACRAEVAAHETAFADMTRRMGYWVDTDRPYRTSDLEFMDAVWGLLGQAWDRGLLQQSSKVVPWCSSCETALSSHEVDQGYVDAVDETFTVLLELAGGGSAQHLAVWTTSPWTLPENRFVGVDPGGSYALVDFGDARAWVSEAFATEKSMAVLATAAGRELVGLRYLPPFGVVADGANEVLAVDFVDPAVGTGLVHLAPSYGAEDAAASRGSGWTEGAPDLGPDGVFAAGPWKGRRYDDVAGTAALHLGDALVDRSPVTHRVATCWRCHSRLVGLARSAWFLRASEVNDEMLASNEQVTWHPEHVGAGRYGEWVAAAVDWTVSRERFWGTPLPVWMCECGHQHLVRGASELEALTGRHLTDLHRDHVDDLEVPCDRCGRPMRRVREVLDCWLDSAAVPTVLYGPDSGPVDLVAEGVDQTRGWFYVLQALAEMTGGGQAYREVLCLGHVVDGEGRKMSKHVGNVLDPFAVFEEHGADALRWFLLAGGSSYTERRVSSDAVQVAVRHLMLLASCVALVTEDGDDDGGGEHPLDAWLAARLSETVVEVTTQLDQFEPHLAAEALTLFVDDVSKRWMRASRDRLARSAHARKFGRDVLATVALLHAPFVPFVAEALYATLTGADDSVHLQSWPTSGPVDDAALAAGAVVWALVDDGRAARKRAGVPLRQPLREVTVRASETLDPLWVEVLGGELNVERVVVDRPMWACRPRWRALGVRYRADAQRVAGLLPTMVCSEDLGVLDVDGEPVDLGELVDLHPAPAVDFDFELDDRLTYAGRLAELLRRVNDARRAAGCERSETVTLWVDDDGERRMLAESQMALGRCRVMLASDRSTAVVTV